MRRRGGKRFDGWLRTSRIHPLRVRWLVTLPNNCNSEYFKLLRFGVDSLYLSYPGELLPNVDDKLKELKKIAQSPEPFEQVKAQYPINGHIFEVKDKGARLFPYILEDNAFRIQLSRSQSVPLAYVKISSEYLTHAGFSSGRECARSYPESIWGGS